MIVVSVVFFGLLAALGARLLLTGIRSGGAERLVGGFFVCLSLSLLARVAQAFELAPDLLLLGNYLRERGALPMGRLSGILPIGVPSPEHRFALSAVRIIGDLVRE